MEVNIINGDKITVELIGRLDTASVTDFDEEIAEVIADDNDVVFDCKDLEYISSSGLRSVLNAHKQLKTAGGSLELVNLQPAVKSVFDLTGFSVILKIL
ncbi:MAG: STAS domain-containing protein [Bacteroidaceae bacterium]|nr:STAS domain-containing protein [Bacteroidaceae bacterium]MBP5523772.1 STAS domain-containing protein [Bacteroidaceae bacterium]